MQKRVFLSKHQKQLKPSFLWGILAHGEYLHSLLATFLALLPRCPCAAFSWPLPAPDALPVGLKQLHICH